MLCSTASGKTRKQKDEDQPESLSSFRLLAARDLLGHGQLLTQPHLNLPLQGQEEEPGWCGFLGNPEASPTCSFSTSFPAQARREVSRQAGDSWGQVWTSREEEASPLRGTRLCCCGVRESGRSDQSQGLRPVITPLGNSSNISQCCPRQPVPATCTE